MIIFYKDLLAKIAPASIILETLYYYGSENTTFRNLYHNDSLFSGRSAIYKVF
jgi:hypothetical protein